MDQLNNTESEKMLANPAYAVNILDFFFQERELKSAKEDWVLINTTLMKDIGAAQWLNELLDVFTLETWEYKGHEIINPYLTVRISSKLRSSNEPVVTREQWVEANKIAVVNTSPEAWLWKLLETLENGAPA
jgi:hypothetical protein